MKAPPPYHLRTNKAVDRFLFVEVLKKVLTHHSLNPKDYTYIGMGGPFLEDLKIIYSHYPEMKLCSLEEDAETIKRQRFHKFCRKVKMLHITDSDFVDQMCEGAKVALWFDYLGCTPSNIGCFATAVRKAGDFSVLRITLNASMPTKEPARQNFIADFNQLIPGNFEEYFNTKDTFFILLQKAVELATSSPIGASSRFYLINSATYEDGARMITMTGIKCPVAEWRTISRRYAKWPFLSRGWDSPPESINLPELSIQERMHLAGLLPINTPNPEHTLKRRLGYSIGPESTLRNYATFCRYFPSFAKLAI